MSEHEVIDAEVLPETALVPTNGVQLGALTYRKPDELVKEAAEIATVLGKIIDDKTLFVTIKGRKHVMVEGWTTLGAMLGIVPIEESSVELPDGSFEGKVKLIRVRDGVQLGGASSLCGMDEETWSVRDRYARKSMATTRATGKAFRLGYSWIMVLAGYEPTPFEEMPLERKGKPQDATSQPSTTQQPRETGDDTDPFPKGFIDTNGMKRLALTKDARTTGGNDYLRINWGGDWYSCFDATLFDALKKGVGKDALLMLETKGKYTNVTGIQQIGNQQYDGKVPYIENATR